MPLTQNLKAPLVAAILLCVVCVLVQAQPQSSASPANPEEPTIGSINGSVVNESGHPLAGVVVFVRETNAGGVSRSTITNSEGSFRVNGLGPALYMVSAFLPAYVMQPVDPDLPANYHRIGETVRLELNRGGVITGLVNNAVGEPLIGARVRALMVRDTKGQMPRFYGFAERTTDDRGIYRIYGLPPGTYVVSAGGAGAAPTFLSSYESDVPTYAPSSTRDTAIEVTVRVGEENNVDIRHRGESGHAISGSVKVNANSGTSITLMSAGNVFVPLASMYQGPTSRGFAFYGVGDGEYDLVAQEVTQVPGSQAPQLAISDRRRVIVKGSDVTGIELVPKPLATINGRIVLEPAKVAACQGKRRPLFAEMFVAVRRPEKDQEKDTLFYMRVLSGSGSPDAKGSFFVRNLPDGRYLLDPNFHARYWYLDSISVGSAPKVDAAANWTTLKAGDQLANVAITVAEGAASIRGRLTTADAAALPTGLGLYLIPADRERVADVLRYFVTPVEADGTFAFNNVPPGRYLAVQQTLDAQTSTLARLRLPEATEARTKLRRAAETQRAELELKPCQNLTDYQLATKQ
jgi:hypothetical protein